MERRLAAIRVADMVDYSRLTGADEEATLSDASLNIYGPPQSARRIFLTVQSSQHQFMRSAWMASLFESQGT